tara:strand:+ start:2203 stop:2322 length:120 start_codon:yes stop_codon:yes gene_type:complete
MAFSVACRELIRSNLVGSDQKPVAIPKSPVSSFGNAELG